MEQLRLFRPGALMRIGSFRASLQSLGLNAKPDLHRLSCGVLCIGPENLALHALSLSLSPSLPLAVSRSSRRYFLALLLSLTLSLSILSLSSLFSLFSCVFSLSSMSSVLSSLSPFSLSLPLSLSLLSSLSPSLSLSLSSLFALSLSLSLSVSVLSHSPTQSNQLIHFASGRCIAPGKDRGQGQSEREGAGRGGPVFRCLRR